MSKSREKILCLVFKYLGDVVVAVPALRALKQSRPNAEIHLLVAEEALPLVKDLPWLHRAWAFPRTRGKARLRDSLPVIAALRREKFDLSLDFIGNDRGAFLSLSIGAPARYGLAAPRGFVGRRWCYHHAVPEAPLDWHESRRHLHFLKPLGVSSTANLDLEIHADPSLQQAAAQIMPTPAILAHLSTSKPLKEWPLENWRALANFAAAAGVPLAFASGPSARERGLLETLWMGAKQTPVLPQINDLALYLAVLSRAQLLVSGDTGPMHFAAGLGVPTLSLFGPSIVHQWAPLSPRARQLQAVGCRCSHNQEACTQPQPCLATLTPELVWQEIQSMLASNRDSTRLPAL